MNNFQRAIYQPLADKVPIYDLADEDPEEERSRVPLLVALALVLLVAFAGVVGITYAQVKERGRQGASLAITAPERLLPEAAPAPRELNEYNEPASPEISSFAPAPQTTAEAETPPLRPSQAAPPPSAAGETSAPTAQPAAGRSSALSGVAVLQLGAFESQELANSAWEAFRARNAMAANWVPDVQRADLGTKGIIYRLRVGPFADRAAATNACVQLKATGATCFVPTP